MHLSILAVECSLWCVAQLLSLTSVSGQFVLLMLILPRTFLSVRVNLTLFIFLRQLGHVFFVFYKLFSKQSFSYIWSHWSHLTAVSISTICKQMQHTKFSATSLSYSATSSIVTLSSSLWHYNHFCRIASLILSIKACVASLSSWFEKGGTFASTIF